MKLEEKQKKRLLSIGLGVVCIALMVGIAVKMQPEEKAAEQEMVLAESMEETTAVVNPVEITPAETTQATVETSPEESIIEETEQLETESSQAVKETVQKIQEKPTKPEPPAEKPTKASVAETMAPPAETQTEVPTTPAVMEAETEAATMAVTEPEQTTVSTPETQASSAGNESGDGKIYVPGFGWMTPSGSIGETVHSEGDINKQVGKMD